MKYELSTEFIPLMSLLKICGLAGTGGQAGILIAEGDVKLNGRPEFRKRAKLRKGDVVECRGQKIEIV